MLQAIPAPHSPIEAVVGAAIVIIQVGTVVLAHFKGKKGAKTADERFADLRTAIGVGQQSLSDEMVKISTDLRADISKLSAHVIGPDGQNGLREDVRQLKVELAEIAPRRRQR